MSRITKKDRLQLLQMACDVAAEGAKNPNVVWMIEFQEQLVETLYRKTSALLESDLERCADDDDEDANARSKPTEVREPPSPPSSDAVTSPDRPKRSSRKAKAARKAPRVA